jgi:hypothetical protein
MEDWKEMPGIGFIYRLCITTTVINRAGDGMSLR